MAETSSGTVDGKSAKIVYYSDRAQTHVYWGGIGRPDGPGHNHATIQNSQPNQFHYLRVNGQLIVDHSYNPQSIASRRLHAGFTIGAILRDSLQRAMRFMGGRW